MCRMKERYVIQTHDVHQYNDLAANVWGILNEILEDETTFP
jgi:hypothetical protein